MNTPDLQQMVAAWVILIVILVFVRWRWKMPGTGLTFAYLLDLSLIHLIGAAIYLLPAYQDRDPRFTTLGFEQALYGVAAFVLGGLVITPLLIKKGLLPRASGVHQPDPLLPKAYIAAGVAFYILSTSFLSHIPTASAIISSGAQLVLVGLALCCWKAWRERHRRKLLFWLAASLVMPAVTLIVQGFLGFGAVAVLTLLIFVASLVRSPWKVTLAGALVVYIGLSVFVSYMRDRDEIRASVWGRQSFSDRIDRVLDTASSIEPFDPGNPVHLQRVDGRLNQNVLVGAAVFQLSQNQNFAHGDTLWDALLALIPRAIWPEKPIRAGSGNLVTRFTGIDFSEGTSVGVGQVLEFYANFGTTGVFIGFLIMGVIVTVLDWQAAERLAINDLHGFVLWFLPGLAFLQVGGQLVEVTASAAASLIVAIMVNKYLYRMQTRAAAPAPPAPAYQSIRVR